MKIYNKILFFIVFLFVFTYINIAVAKAQSHVIKKHAWFSLQTKPTEARAGEKVRFILQAKIDEGWHIYSLHLKGEDLPPPTKVVFTSPFTKTTPVYETRVIHKIDKVIGVALEYHKEKAYFYQNVDIPLNIKSQTYPISAQITYQTCSDKACFPPVTESVKNNITITQGSARKTYLQADHSIAPIYYIHKSKSLIASFSAFILLAILMGFASLLAPCVFPMIPIIFSFFTKQASEKPAVTARLSLLFIIGIIATFILLGTFVSVLFGASAVVNLASSAWTNLAIGILFVIFALQLIGILHINIIPLSWQQAIDEKARKQKNNRKAVLLMGIAFAITSFTCSVPFVGTLLVSAMNGTWLYPLVGMFFFSFAFSLPFFVLAWIPRFANVFRKVSSSSIWISTFRVFAGFIELGLAIKFFSNADLVATTNWLSRDLILLIWAILIVVFCLYCLYAFFYSTRKKKNLQTTNWLNKAIASLFIVILLAVAIWLEQGTGNYSRGALLDSLLPPQAMRTNKKELLSLEEQKKVVWLTSLQKAKSKAVKTKQAILVEFTGYSCVNCRWMEQNMLIRKDVNQALTSFVKVKLYTDGGTRAKENLDYQIKKFHTVALPFYAIITKQNTILATFSGLTRNKQMFIDFLQNGQNSLNKK